MATTYNRILIATGISSKEYEEIILEKYMTLTSKMSNNFQHQQILLMDKSVNEWFLNEVEQINNNFLIDVYCFKKRSKKTLKGVYLANIHNVTKRYPNVLIKEIKNPKNTEFFTRQN